ncbi:MAG: ImmA/IrrE family metallo-endopeptidase [Gordonia polyisoprenivorans]|nr:ImmA/IrrE family metallo-endopeptidase [Gordonia polyisoprenivorans]
MNSFANGRLRNLRELHGLSQTEFAARLGLSQAALSHIESGRRPVPDTVIASTAHTFSVAPSFFVVEPVEYTSTDLNYRTKKLSARERRMANTAFGLTEQILRSAPRVKSSAELHPTASPADSRRPVTEIEHLAATAREQIGIAQDKVINNVVRCIERTGVLVTGIALPPGAGRIDGISTPKRSDDSFVMTLDLDKPGDRIRFSAAHELGHLLLHTVSRPTSDAIRESEADTFASAFLLPRAAILRELSPDLTLNGYAQIKARWGVSIQAIVRRARDLHVITDDRYRSLHIQLSSRGWRTSEPVDIPRETPAIPTPDLTGAAQTTSPAAPTGSSGSNVVSLFGNRA